MVRLDTAESLWFQIPHPMLSGLDRSGARSIWGSIDQARSMSTTTEIVLDPVESSKLAGLRYVTDEMPGFTRKRRGKSVQYLDAHGKPIRARS